MFRDDEMQRLIRLESRLGHKLPDDLLRLLRNREPIVEGELEIPTPDRAWDVRTSYGLSDKYGSALLEDLYNRVGHALPPGALPIASDWGGNFYCVMLNGLDRGCVVYWDHERELGDHSVELVAGSVQSFFERLLPCEASG